VTAAANLYAEPLQLFDTNGNPIGSGEQAYNYLESLSPAAQDILLNRIFFGLVRDSGREYTGAAGGGNYEIVFGPNSGLNPAETIDTTGALNTAYRDYQRAYAAIGAFLSGMSGTSSTGMTLGLGAKTFFTQPNLRFTVGETIALTDSANGADRMVGTILAYNQTTGTMTVDVTSASGSGTASGWTIGTFGDFLGGLSTVRTLAGGDISILSPNGQIQAGLLAAPSGFPGWSDPTDPIYALDFGIVTEKGGDIDLYADGNITVNESRVFTLEGGDLTVISRTGNIDAGRGSKTVQAVQPPFVSYDPYGNATITPYGPASGSGLAVLRAVSSAPASKADLISFIGIVNAGDAGIRVSGDLNIAAVEVLNASNIQVAGTETGVPTIVAPNIGALTTASNAAGQAAAAATDAATQARKRPEPQDLPSIITVEVIGYGGGDAAPAQDQQKKDRSKGGGKQSSYDPDASVRVVGYGPLSTRDTQGLTEEEKRSLARP
jgi:hypothetical protein